MNANPVRIACQEFSDMADSGGVAQFSSQHKILCIAGCPQITGVLGAEGADSLRQAVFGGSNPVRAEIGQSCQDHLEDGSGSGAKTGGLTGRNLGRNRQENPVRISEVAR